MFSKLKELVRQVINKVFNKTAIEQSTKMDISVSNEMASAIDLWGYMYKDESPWVDDKETFSLNLAAGIASEFATLTSIEFESGIANNDFLNREYQKVVDNIRNYTEFAAAKGGLALKPYVSEGKIVVDMVQADEFFPTKYTSRGDITGAIFIETKQMGKTTYRRVEQHDLAGTDYNISQKAYRQDYTISNDNSLGWEVPLTEVEEWAELEPMVTIKEVEKPLFAYFKMPFANNVDYTSPLGVSVYAKATKLIQKADEQYSRILWEYEGSELAVDIDRDMVTKDEHGNEVMPKGRKRLYRKFDFDNDTNKWNVFSPQIRESSLFYGLNQYLRRIEFLVGLAYGTLSDVSEVDKTATEIISSKQRSYDKVSDIQKALRNALENLAYAMWKWGDIAKLGVSELDLEKDISFKFDDSIVVDKNTELAGMLNDVSAGILRPEIYLAKKYGVSEQEALKMMPDMSNSVKTGSPFDGMEE